MKQLLIFLTMIVCCGVLEYSHFDLTSFQDDTISVSVRGEVEEERIIQIPQYSSINDIYSEIELSDDADISTLNPQQILHDKDVIVIPKQKEEGSLSISINHASEEELILLPGVGPSTAKKIIQYRNENGLFQSTDDLLFVSGIGETKYEKLKEFITL